MSDETLRTSQDPESWGLPEKVAYDNGYFAEEGVSVEFVEETLSQELPEALDQRPKTEDIKEAQFRNEEVDTYSVCEWGAIKRTHDLEDGKVIAKRTREGFTHRIYVRPDSPIETPDDLADTPVAVNHNAGSYYAVYEALEDHLAPDQIHTVHVGNPSERFKALRDGRVDAASLMEPYQTLADYVGYRGIIESPARGSRVAAPGHEDEVRVFITAFNRAVEQINTDPAQYRTEYLERLDLDRDLLDDLDITLEDLYDQITVPEYDGYEIVDEHSLHDTLDWMHRYDMIDQDADLKQLLST